MNKQLILISAVILTAFVAVFFFRRDAGPAPLREDRVVESAAAPEAPDTAVGDALSGVDGVETTSENVSAAVPVDAMGVADQGQAQDLDQGSGLGKKLSPSEFQRLAREVEDSLPKKSDLKNLSAEETHHTPKILVEAGARLGSIAEALANNPSLEKDGLSFYQSCAGTEENPNSLRALCFSHYRKLSLKLGNKVDESIVPKDVLVTLQRLPGL